MAKSIERMHWPALVAAVIGSVQVVLGFSLAQALWPEFNSMKSTISDLAADDSPVQVLMSSFFYFGATLSLVVAFWARTFSVPGRITIALAGLATYGLAFFTTPSQDSHSDAHRIFAVISFVLSSAWPLFAMRFDKRYPWIVRPAGAILGTLAMTIASLVFLASWTDSMATMTGFWERVIAVGQTWYLAAVIWICWFSQRKAL
ncbi:MAG: hypothetical protein RL149_489 [Actinomycetota bacterium]|jgi:hypothetical protein